MRYELHFIMYEARWSRNSSNLNHSGMVNVMRQSLKTTYDEATNPCVNRRESLILKRMQCKCKLSSFMTVLLDWMKYQSAKRNNCSLNLMDLSAESGHLRVCKIRDMISGTLEGGMWMGCRPNETYHWQRYHSSVDCLLNDVAIRIFPKCNG